MELEFMETENEWTIRVTGRIDTMTSPKFEKELIPAIYDYAVVHIDFEKVDYVSSAGLRVLLNGQKTANKEGKQMKCRNISPEVEEVLEITGFIDILVIE